MNFSLFLYIFRWRGEGTTPWDGDGDWGETRSPNPAKKLREVSAGREKWGEVSPGRVKNEVRYRPESKILWWGINKYWNVQWNFIEKSQNFSNVVGLRPLNPLQIIVSFIYIGLQCTTPHFISAFLPFCLPESRQIFYLLIKWGGVGPTMRGGPPDPRTLVNVCWSHRR